MYDKPVNGGVDVFTSREVAWLACTIPPCSPITAVNSRSKQHLAGAVWAAASPIPISVSDNQHNIILKLKQCNELNKLT
jgi:hypothetical protein